MPTPQEKFMHFAKLDTSSVVDIHHTYTSNPEFITLDATDGTKKSLIDYSAMRGNIDVIIWLALAGIARDTQTAAGKSPLYRAIEKKKRCSYIITPAWRKRTCANK